MSLSIALGSKENKTKQNKKKENGFLKEVL